MRLRWVAWRGGAFFFLFSFAFSLKLCSRPDARPRVGFKQRFLQSFVENSGYFRGPMGDVKNHSEKAKAEEGGSSKQQKIELQRHYFVYNSSGKTGRLLGSICPQAPAPPWFQLLLLLLGALAIRRHHFFCFFFCFFDFFIVKDVGRLNIGFMLLSPWTA